MRSMRATLRARNPTGLADLRPSGRDASTIAAEHGHQWLHPDRQAEPRRHRTLAHHLGIKVDVWTVDEPEEIRMLAAAGVDAIVTNVPDVALAALTS